MVLFSEEPIRFLQGFSTPWLDAIFIAITELGRGRTVLFGLAMLVYWILSKRTGFLLTVVLLTSSVVNSLLKIGFDMPRPSDSLHKVGSAGNGFPSGHAQTTTVFWVTAASLLKTFWIPLAILMVPLVAFSRVYLGVHFVGDVLGGVAFGLGVVACALLAVRWFPWSRLDLRSKLLLALLGPTAVQGVLVLTMGRAFTALGLLSGVCVGYLLEAKWVGLAPTSELRRIVLRIVLGGGTLAAFEYLSERIEDAANAPVMYGLEFLIGIVATLVLPWLFKRVEASIRRSEAAPAAT